MDIYEKLAVVIMFAIMAAAPFAFLVYVRILGAFYCWLWPLAESCK